ncbi:hypothetical protein ACFLY0_01365 [Patescibacteria group bacterium]
MMKQTIPADLCTKDSLDNVKQIMHAFYTIIILAAFLGFWELVALVVPHG